MPELTIIPKKVLVGPTASGKTEVIHILSRMLGFGVISADASMVYQGMDIGTAKPTPEERAGITYAGIDLARPDRMFSVHDYLLSVDKAMQSRSAENPEWVIAGGTGLYVRCLLSGLDNSDGPHTDIRISAQAVFDAEGLKGLIAWCRTRIPGIDAYIPEGDICNPRRWIRAVERGVSGKKTDNRKVPDDVAIVGLRWSRNELENRIRRRVDLMYRSGLLEEVKKLRESYTELSETAKKAIGYAEAMSVMDQEMTIDEAKKRTMIRTRQYAKRQMTWFNNQFAAKWVDVTPDCTAEQTAERVLEAWSTYG